METTSKAYIVAESILRQSSKFTPEDIADEIYDTIKGKFTDKQSLKRYVNKRLEIFCDNGLVSGTGIEYWVNT